MTVAAAGMLLALPLVGAATRISSWTGPRPFAQLSWDGPWVFASGGGGRAALPALDNSQGQLTNGPIRIRLDDGSDGALRIESGPCRDTDDCTFDCICSGPNESFWITVTGAAGRNIARLHLWAAYRTFQIVPVDLIDGAGDELLIARIANHASPPTGYDLKIWKLGATTPTDLGSGIRVAGLIGTGPVGCGHWRTTLFIDQSNAKPRPIQLRSEFGSAPDCNIDPDEAAAIADLGVAHSLRFDVSVGKYTIR